MLFDGECPGLLDACAQIVLKMKKILEEKGMNRVPSRDRMKEQQKIERRPNLEEAPHHKATRVDLSSILVLLHEHTVTPGYTAEIGTSSTVRVGPPASGSAGSRRRTLSRYCAASMGTAAYSLHEMAKRIGRARRPNPECRTSSGGSAICPRPNSPARSRGGAGRTGGSAGGADGDAPTSWH